MAKPVRNKVTVSYTVRTDVAERFDKYTEDNLIARSQLLERLMEKFLEDPEKYLALAKKK
jgi:hypothetical protein